MKGGKGTRFWWLKSVWPLKEWALSALCLATQAFRVLLAVLCNRKTPQSSAVEILPCSDGVSYTFSDTEKLILFVINETEHIAMQMREVAWQVVPQSSALAIDCSVLLIHAMQIAFLILLLLVYIFLVQDLPANSLVLSLERQELFLAKFLMFLCRASAGWAGQGSGALSEWIHLALTSDGEREELVVYYFYRNKDFKMVFNSLWFWYWSPCGICFLVSCLEQTCGSVLLFMLNIILHFRYTKPLTFADCISDELPLGWEEAYDPQVGVYYIDHNTSKWHATVFLQSDLCLY